MVGTCMCYYQASQPNGYDGDFFFFLEWDVLFSEGSVEKEGILFTIDINPLVLDLDM